MVICELCSLMSSHFALELKQLLRQDFSAALMLVIVNFQLFLKNVVVSFLGLSSEMTPNWVA